MKKFYVSFLTVGLVFAANAQGVPVKTKKMSVDYPNHRAIKPVANNTEKVLIWSEDFANGLAGNNGSAVQTWSVDGVRGDIWKHDFYGTSGSYSTNTADFESTTANNGFMLFDHDSTNTSENGFQNPGSWATYTGSLVSPTIDCSAFPGGVVFEMQQDFRYCCSASHNINLEVSDDDGATWGAPIDLVNGAAANQDYLSANGSYLIQRNISAYTNASATVKFRITWDADLSGNLAYYYVVDDINLVDWPADDLQMLTSWISGENNEGFEYGRTPENQQDDNYLVGATVYNFGSNDQDNVNVDVDFTSFTSNSSMTIIESDSTRNLESTEAIGPLAIGMYTGNYQTVSDQETTAGPLFGNNTGLREFEITSSTTTNGSTYSLDGIDVYSNVNLSSLGTNSFTDGEDGLILATMYHIKEATAFNFISIELANGSVEGAEIRAFIVDTADFFAKDFTAPVDEASSYLLTQGDVDDGTVYFPLGQTTLSPGAYFVCVELFSAGNTFDARILDDQTVDQPFFGSMIYIPSPTDAVYSNGNATAIRLTNSSNIGIEANNLEGIEIYPNPSEGLVNVTNENGYNNTITVFDMFGKEISSVESSSNATIDLTSVNTGVYLVKVTNELGSMVQRVVIK